MHGSLQWLAEDITLRHPLGLALGVAELPDRERHRLGTHALHRQPRRSALDVRVRSCWSSRSTTSSCPLMTATSNGVAPSGRFSFTSDPVREQAATAFKLPLHAANKSGVAPLLERALMSAQTTP